MAKIDLTKLPHYKNPVEGFSEDWSQHSGEEVQEFLESQLLARGCYLYRSPQAEEDGNIYLYVFRSKAECDDWIADPENTADLVKQKIMLPNGGGSSSATFSCQFFTDQPATIISTDNRVIFGIRFISQEFNPITQAASDTGEGGTLKLDILNGTKWETAAEIQIDSLPASSTDYRQVDLTPYLHQGTQQIRMMVRGDSSGAPTSTRRFTVTLTEVNISNATAWEQPSEDGVLRMQYFITGAVAKTLHVKIDGTTEITSAVGTTVFAETPRQISSGDEPLAHGLHSVEAWVTIDGTDKRTDSVHMQMMVATDSTDTAPRILTANDAAKVDNWATSKLAEYALYNPSGESLPVTITLENYNGTETYMTVNETLAPGARKTLESSVEIDGTATTLNAYLRFKSGTTSLHSDIGIIVDNSEGFAPTAGADFIFNPRSNGGHTHGRIVNAATGQEVPSEWTGFSGSVADGITVDADGRTCLRVLRGEEIVIDYEAMSAVIATTRNSTTIEFDIATRNVIDETAPLIRIGQPLAADGKILGFELRGLDCYLLTRNNRSILDQEAGFSEGRRTHIAVNIIAGIYGSSRNYVRIFVDGNLYREFSYAYNDTFTAASGSGGIRLGGADSGADIDIYGVRVLKKALSALDINKDRIATLPTAAEKRAVRAANDILGDNGEISYPKAAELYNTMLVETAGGVVPSYANPAAITASNVTVRRTDDTPYTRVLGACGLKGQGTSSMSYWMWNFTITINGEWTDENGVKHNKTFALDPDCPDASKLVAKRNWASSMQSHKMGCVNLYTDLHRSVIGSTGIAAQEGMEKTRRSVKQAPFMMFVKNTDTGEIRFYGLYTFGPGKGDKPTFGFDKSRYPEYMMLEGSDNGQPLTGHAVPWNEDVKLDPSGEFVMYNGAKQFEIGMGTSQTTLAKFKDLFNYLYLHNPNIAPWTGTFAELQGSQNADRQKFYWLTLSEDGHSQYDLQRFDPLTEQWVDAGVEKLGAGKYAKLNLKEQLGITPSSNLWDTVNREFINARAADFRLHAGEHYLDTRDAMFHKSFQDMIVAASDNWKKNTYWFYDPVTGLIGFHVDDNDTIFPTDNVGRNRKPYYVEAHDTDENGAPYWNGDKAALWCLLELAYAEELRTMTFDILNAMANLCGSVEACYQKYFFSTQEYFPAVAYNETARISYEAADQAMIDGSYTTNTPPLTQSLGSQLEAEREWVRRRIVYISSYAGYGMFAMNGAGSLQFRSIVKRDGSNPSYRFKLTPHIWMYPAVSNGSSTIRGKRTPAGEVCEMATITSDGNTNIQIHGADWLRSVGDFSAFPVGEAFALTGARLTEFVAAGTEPEFRPTSITVAAPNLRKLDLTGVSTLSGGVGLAGSLRLTEILLSGTAATSVTVGNPAVVEKLRLPVSLTSLSLTGYAALTSANLNIGGLTALTDFEIADCPQLNMQSITESVLSGAASLERVRLIGVDFAGFSAANLGKLVSIASTSEVTGRIALADNQNMTFELKRKCLAAWGDIDSESNPLYIEYIHRPVDIIRISGAGYYDKPGDYQLRVIPEDPNANDFTAIEWDISTNAYADIDTRAGRVHVTSVGTEADAPTATVTVTITKSDATTVSKSASVRLYKRSMALGDYVYADGSYSDKWDDLKTAVAQVWLISKEHGKAIAVAMKNADSYAYGNMTSDIVLSDSVDFDTAVINGIPLLNTFIDNSPSEMASLLCDETSLDGWKQSDVKSNIRYGFMTLTEAIGEYEEGDVIPVGLYETLCAIRHRNRILSDSGIQLPIPAKTQNETEMANFKRLLNEANTTPGSGYRYYFPLFSAAHAYEPTIGAKETLHPKFSAHKWFVPAPGDMLRFMWVVLAASGDKQIFSDSIASQRFDGIRDQYAVYWGTTGQFGSAWRVAFMYYKNKINGLGSSSGGYQNKSYSGILRPMIMIDL